VSAEPEFILLIHFTWKNTRGALKQERPIWLALPVYTQGRSGLQNADWIISEDMKCSWRKNWLMATAKIKDRYMTIRLPADIERELRKMAEANTRTLAAQVLHYIKHGLNSDRPTS
jgi:hypothetical protein